MEILESSADKHVTYFEFPASKKARAWYDGQEFLEASGRRPLGPHLFILTEASASH